MALADWAAIAIANARRHVGMPDQRDELVRAVRAFETSEAIGRALAGETGLDKILELIVKRSRALVQARVMIVALREGEDLVIRAAAGEGDRSQLGMAIAIADSLSGDVLTSGRARRMSDSTPSLRAALPRAFGAHTALIVPLRFAALGLRSARAQDSQVRLEEEAGATPAPAYTSVRRPGGHPHQDVSVETFLLAGERTDVADFEHA